MDIITGRVPPSHEPTYKGKYFEIGAAVRLRRSTAACMGDSPRDDGDSLGVHATPEGYTRCAEGG